MNDKPFLDTNVLVYAFSDDARADAADELLRAGGVISVQVLNEFVNVSRRKLSFKWTEVDNALNEFKDLLNPAIPLTAELHERAVEIARKHKLRIYDSLIVAAAIAAGCPILYTEDMQHGRKIGGTIIRNPFRA